MNNASWETPGNGPCDILQTIHLAKKEPTGDGVGKLLDLYRNYLKLLAQSQINPRLRQRIDASDVVQETFLDAHRDFEDFQGATEAQLLAWLRSILASNIVDLARKHGAKCRDIRREQSLEAAMSRSSVQLGKVLADDEESPSQQARRREQAVIVADAIAALPDEQRLVITLRQVHRIPFADIGRQLGKTSGAVRMIWLRALESLRKEVSEQ